MSESEAPKREPAAGERERVQKQRLLFRGGGAVMVCFALFRATIPEDAADNPSVLATIGFGLLGGGLGVVLSRLHWKQLSPAQRTAAKSASALLAIAIFFGLRLVSGAIMPLVLSGLGGLAIAFSVGPEESL